MAQHIPMRKMSQKKYRDRAEKLIGTKLTRFSSLKWEMITPNRFSYVKGLRVPESMVCGGQADMEAITDDKDIILEVYFVA